jgi:hypothetical protein
MEKLISLRLTLLLLAVGLVVNFLASPQGLGGGAIGDAIGMAAIVFVLAMLFAIAGHMHSALRKFLDWLKKIGES